MPTTDGSSTRRSDSVALLVGSAVNGLAAYGYIVVGTQSFGAEAFAPVSILWTIWALSVAVVTFPLQHWTIRSITATGDDSEIRSALRSIVSGIALFAVFVFTLTTLERSILFGDSGMVYPTMAAVIVVQAGALGFARGMLSGRGRYKAAAVLLGGENLLRLSAGIFFVLVGASATWYAAALLVGVLILIPYANDLALAAGPRSMGTSAIRALGGIAGGTLIAQVVLTGPPIVASLIGLQPAQVTAVFTTSAVFRAPYLVALGLALRGMGRLTELAHQEAERLARLLRLATVGGIAASMLVVPVAWVLAPPVLEFMFGAETALPGLPTGLFAAGSVLAVVSLGLVLVLIATASTRWIAVSWMFAALVGAMVALLPNDPLVAVSAAFAAAELSAVVALAFFAHRSVLGTSDTLVH